MRQSTAPFPTSASLSPRLPNAFLVWQYWEYFQLYKDYFPFYSLAIAVSNMFSSITNTVYLCCCSINIIIWTSIQLSVMQYPILSEVRMKINSNIFFSSQTCQSKHWEAEHKLMCKQAKPSDKACSVTSENSSYRRRKSSGSASISLVPARGSCKELREPKKVE